MSTITSSDTVMASAWSAGAVLAEISSPGFSSVSDVVNSLLRSIGNARGLVEVELRNASRGWREQRRIHVGMRPEGIQLSLF